MAARKTIQVSELVAKANTYFAAAGGTPEARKMLQSFVGDFLHATGNYQGFGYLTADRVPPGEKPGIVYKIDDSKDNLYPDDSRVVLYARNRG